MRKKKEKADVPRHCKKYTNYKSNSRKRSNFSILQKHEDKLSYFKKNNLDVQATQKQLDNVRLQLSEQKCNNSKCHKLIRVQKTLEENLENSQQIKQQEIDYLLESCQLVHEYLLLEEEEKKLLSLKNATNEQIKELNDILNKKSVLTDEYFMKFDENYSPVNFIPANISVCSNCNDQYKLYSGYLVCPSCGNCIDTLDTYATLSYKEMQNYEYKSQFTYDKRSHLDDWLRRFQAKENRTIPQEVLDKILLETKKERITNLNDLTEEKIKRYLKKLSLNEYYDNIIGIINRINGRPPFRLTFEIEEKIKSMFQSIQEPFEKYKPNNRKNFLSYSYTLHKFFQILGLHEFSKYFPLLKSVDKLRQQDEIFQKIVAEMAQKDNSVDWVFYPSL